MTKKKKMERFYDLLYRISTELVEVGSCLPFYNDNMFMNMNTRKIMSCIKKYLRDTIEIDF